MENYIDFLNFPKDRIRKVERYKNVEYYVSFRSKKIANILNSFGIVKNKTKAKFKKEYLPCLYFSDYLRGLFEADGYYGIYPNPRLSTEVRLANNDTNFLKIIANKINELGFTAQVYLPINKKHNTKVIRIKSCDQARFLKWLYSDANYKLTRKRIIANDIIKIRKGR